MKKLFLLLIVIASVAKQSHCQQSKIDSLQKVLLTQKEDTNKVNLLNTLAIALMWNNKPDTAAISLIEQAKKISEKIKYKKGISKTQYARIEIGRIYRVHSKLNEALKQYTIASKIFEDIKDEDGVAKSYRMIASIHFEQGNYPAALRALFISLKKFEEIDSKKGIADVYIDIGKVYSAQGNYADAQTKFKNALKIYEGIDNKVNIAITHNYIGDIYKIQRNYPDALKESLFALKLLENNNGDLTWILSVKYNIGCIYTNLGKYAQALEAFFFVKRISQETGGYKPGLAGAYSGIGEVYLKQGKPKQANEEFEKALPISKEIGDKDDIKEIYSLRAKADSALMNYKSAYENYKMFVLYRDSLINQENTKKTVQTQMQYEFDKKESLTKAEQDKKDAVTTEEKRRQKMFLFSVIGGLVLVIVFSGFLFNRFRVTQRQKKIIEKQKLLTDEKNKIIEEKNKDITDSINYAQRIQRALLASDSLLNKNLGEHFVLFKPKDIVSGDFYWATETVGSRQLAVGNETANRFYLAVCDSTGHGVPGAFMSLLNISFLNEAINEEELIQPNEIFNHVRQRLIQNISQDGGKDGMDGILISLKSQVSNSKSQGSSQIEISYAAAHNAPVIVHNGELTELDADKMPVGAADKLDSFKLQTLNLKPGTILYLYTDGFADQFGGPKGKKFKYKPLNEKLLAISDKPMAEQKNILEKTFEDWKGNLEQVDDVLVIGIRV